MLHQLADLARIRLKLGLIVTRHCNQYGASCGWILHARFDERGQRGGRPRQGQALGCPEDCGRSTDIGIRILQLRDAKPVGSLRGELSGVEKIGSGNDRPTT